MNTTPNTKLTLVSVGTPTQKKAVFVQATMCDGRVRVDMDTLMKITGPLPRGTTISVG